jgi:hypothetical protein
MIEFCFSRDLQAFEERECTSTTKDARKTEVTARWTPKGKSKTLERGEDLGE